MITKEWIAIIILSCMLAFVGLEHQEIARELHRERTLYDDFLSQRVKGKMLSEYIRSESLSVFNLNGVTVVCGMAKETIVAPSE